MVERVAAAETYELRHRVLGRGATPADVAAPDDDDPGCGHFAGQQVLMQRDVADCGG